MLYRGDEFRTAFAHLGDLRSVVPDSVGVIALTATSTRTTFDVLTHVLSMSNPVVVGMAPDRKNITYFVEPKPEVITHLAKDISEKGITFPKTVIFCRKYNDCYLSLSN